MKQIKGIAVKKKYGQHFLRKQSVVDHMINAVSLNKTSSVLEVGCGDGFLTKTILQAPSSRLWIFEIDPEWVEYVRDNIHDERLTIFEENILDIDVAILQPFKPWTFLSNIPYQITFPILHLIQKNRELFAEGVIMVQEEVAQKILKTRGRGYGYISLFFQHYFEWKKLEKILPEAFYPPPKVHSRLLYFKPKKQVVPITNEDDYWKYIKACFRQPRRTLKNNLQQSQYDITKLSSDILALRAQQLGMDELLALWNQLVSR